jgi:hypothetical protein
MVAAANADAEKRITELTKQRDKVLLAPDDT